jgi:hypothetical protein
MYRKKLSGHSLIWSKFHTSGRKGICELGLVRRLSKYNIGQIRSILDTNDKKSALILSIERQLSAYNNGSIHLSYFNENSSSLKFRFARKIAQDFTFYSQVIFQPNFTDFEIGISKYINNKTNIFTNISQNKISFGLLKIIKNKEYGIQFIIARNALLIDLSFKSKKNKIEIPIIITNSINLKTISATILIPSLLIILIKKYIIDPRRLQDKKSKTEKIRQENAEAMNIAFLNSISEINLMKNTVQRNKKIEEEKKGLVIIDAKYGYLDSIIEDENIFIDVTIPLQYLVEDSQLHLHNNSKQNLLGFYDPCIGMKKNLYIRYLFHDKIHQIIIEDKDPISIPLQSHSI